MDNYLLEGKPTMLAPEKNDKQERCPECGSDDIRRIRRITGYFSTVDKFNDSKLAELRDRVSHTGFEEKL